MSVGSIASPVSSGDRVISLDLARGVALIGIFLCNLPSMGRPLFESFNGSILSNIPWMQEFLVLVHGLSGTQRGLFSMLFGAGLVIFMERLAAKDIGMEGADIYFRRVGWMFAFGVVNVYIFLWPGDILMSYALVTFLAFACRNMLPRRLFLLASILVLFSVVQSIPSYMKVQDEFVAYEIASELKNKGSELSEDHLDAIAAWDKKFDHTPTIKSADKDREKVASGLIGTWQVVYEFNKFILTNLLFSITFIGTLIMFLIGMGLYKVGFFTAHFPIKVLWITALLGMGLGLPFRLQEAMTKVYSIDPVINSLYAMLYHVDRVVLSLGMMATLVLIARAGKTGPIKRAFAAMGRMALTNYLTQSIIASLIFFGFGLYGHTTGYDLFTILIGVTLLQLVWSPLWLKYFRFGPFEWLWRSLTYGRKMPMKRMGHHI